MPDLELRVVDENAKSYVLVKSKVYAVIDLYIKESQTDSVIIRHYIQPLDSQVIYDLGKGKKEELVKNFNVDYNIGYYLGDPENIVPDLDYLYSLPFKKGKKYSVSQGPNGSFTHNDIISRYAIDFQLEIGEPIHAARAGKVIKVIDRFKESGGEDYRHKANRVLVLHEDGTIASYVHLNYEGVVVNEGEMVEKGQLIGYSGNTGFTRGPHLHFVVRKERDISIPVYFEGYEGKELRKRKKYKRTK